MSDAAGWSAILIAAYVALVGLGTLTGIRVDYAARFAAIAVVVLVGVYITVRVIQVLDETLVLLRRLNDRDRGPSSGSSAES